VCLCVCMHHHAGATANQVGSIHNGLLIVCDGKSFVFINVNKERS
jgi:hypothetical protein